MGPHRGHPSPEAEAIDRGLGLGIGPGGHLLHSCCGLASCCCFAGAERASEPAIRRASRSLRRYPRQTYHHVCFRVTLVGSSIHQPVMRYVRAPSQLRTSGRTPRPKRQNKRTQAKNTRLSRRDRRLRSRSLDGRFKFTQGPGCPRAASERREVERIEARKVTPCFGLSIGEFI